MMRGRSVPFGTGVLTFGGVFSGAVTLRAHAEANRPTVSPTPRQLELLRFVRGYHLAHDGISPSVEEVRIGLGMANKGGVHRLLLACEERGVLRRMHNQTRAMEVLIDVAVPTAPDGAPLYCVPVASLSHGDQSA